MSGFGKFVAGMFVVCTLVFCSGGCSGMTSSKASQAKPSKPAATVTATTKNTATQPTFNQNKTAKPTYQDPRWPTTSPELLAIPESDRWYNAHEKIGEYGTIAGPVKRVYQAKDSQGMPVFIDIGEDYPSANRAQVVLWAEDVAYCEEMLHAIDHGGAWVAFTGQISLYNGVPEINFSDGPVSWTYWTR